MAENANNNQQAQAQAQSQSTQQNPNGQQGQAQSQSQNGQQAQPQQPSIDYDKLAQIVAGKQTVTEDTVLKNFFKQQGLTGDEMTAAINAYKQQKAANTPDVGTLQTQVQEMQAQAAKAALEQAATLEAIKLGVSVDAVPFVLKMVDLTPAVKDGKPDAASIQTSIKAVIDAIPGLKSTVAPQENEGANNGTQQQAGGFIIGASGQQQNQAGSTPHSSRPAVAQKRWNRFNH